MVGVSLAGFGCSSNQVQLRPYQDISKQKPRENRISVQEDMDLSRIMQIEGTQPEEIQTIKAWGILYVTAVGFKNLYKILPDDKKTCRFKSVKLEREQVLPFKEIKFDWAENNRVSFQWVDEQGAHTNVLDKKGKAR